MKTLSEDLYNWLIAEVLRLKHYKFVGLKRTASRQLDILGPENIRIEADYCWSLRRGIRLFRHGVRMRDPQCKQRLVPVPLTPDGLAIYFQERVPPALPIRPPARRSYDERSRRAS